jgi:hypothetical protein
MVVHPYATVNVLSSDWFCHKPFHIQVHGTNAGAFLCHPAQPLVVGQTARLYSWDKCNVHTVAAPVFDGHTLLILCYTDRVLASFDGDDGDDTLMHWDLDVETTQSAFPYCCNNY